MSQIRIPFSLSRRLLPLTGISIRLRLGLGFGFIIALVCAIAAMAWLLLTSTSRRIDELQHAQTEAHSLIGQMIAEVNTSYDALLCSVLLTDPEDLADQKRILVESPARYDAIEARLAKLLDHDGVPAALRDQFHDLQSNSETAKGSLRSLIDMVGDPQRKDAMSSQVANTLKSYFERWLGSAAKLRAAREQAARAEQAEMTRTLQRASWLFAVAAAAAVAIGGFAAWSIARSVNRPLTQAISIAERIAQGNLSHEIAAAGPNAAEIRALLDALGRMQAGLRTLVQEVRESASEIAYSSGEIAAGNRDLSQRTELTAGSLQQAASTMQQVTGSVRQTADATRSASQFVGTAVDTARLGGQVVADVVARMDEIIGDSRRIADITAVIDGIAFQTNILALNAAIEAARAGNLGRGFAVVAGEVRSLAQRSATAARDIKDLISESVTKIESGNRLVRDAGGRMQQIVRCVEDANRDIGQISDAVSRQSTEFDQIGAAVVEVDKMTQSNSALVEQSMAASESLYQQTVKLRSLVETFVVDAKAQAIAA
ncbi:methyl-accepting chemotaxis protein [Ideonella sp. B508-1]|uniref:methyl-accepting chemotaxis protein n=1 Tax=Ideonella sp. B508-1 TaxID=137716 RepID=UPI000345DB74|nr:methyl-accepting chemotaxis protein [Ideonella sp. B508-1]